MKRIFLLKGLDCSNCSAKIEKEVGELDGVQSSVVNLMKQTLTINVTQTAADTIASQIETIVYSHEPDVEVQEETVMNVTKSYSLKGLDCPNCSAKIEKEVGTVEEVLKMDDYIKGISEKIKDTFSAFYLGRGLDYGIACEACLKLKEISYVNAEAYCAGELKHGTISLITEGVPIIAIATQENVLPKLMANVEEVKARGAHVIVVTDKDMSNYEGIYDDLIQVPATDDLFATFASTVALQLLAYHVTVFRGYDVDQPRNLAKSVTVE